MGRQTASEVKRPQDLREGNIRRLFRLLTERESFTVNELAGKMNLSRTAVQNILARLKDGGIVTESGKRSSSPQGGKCAVSYTVCADYKYGIYIVVSTTQLVVQLNDFANNEIGSRIADASRFSYEELIGYMKREIESLMNERELTMDRLFGIVLTVSGTVDSDNGVLVSFTGNNQTGKWGENIPVIDDLRKAVGFDGEMYIDSFCAFSGYNCYSSLPASKRTDTCLYVLAHRLGVGAALIRNGKIDKGAHGLLGEIGHIKLDLASEAVCRCGRAGCFEAMLYPESIRRRVSENEVLRMAGIESIEGMMLRANEGNIAARAEVRYYADLYAQLIYNVQIMTDPDCVIFHDAYAVHSEDFCDELKTACMEKSEGSLRVPIDLYVNDTGFLNSVKSGAVAYLRSRFIDHFQED